MTGCARKSSTSTGQYFLGNSTFKGNKTVSDAELDALIPQRPNSRFLSLPIFPKVGIYQFGQLFYKKDEKQRKVIEVTQNYQKELRLHENSTRLLEKTQRKYAKKLARAQKRVDEGNFWMRVLGEAPVYFVESDAEKNAEKMQKYLYNNGFFQNTVTFKTDTTFRRIRVKYLINENRPTILDKINYQVRSALIDSLLKNASKEGLLVTKKRYDGDAFEEERIRIETLLRNQGYFGFSRQNVTFMINDTITKPKTDSLFKTVDVHVNVSLPAKESNPKPYTISSVQFEVLPPAGLPDSLFKKDTIFSQGIQYIFADKRFAPRILDTKIRIRPGDVYSQRNERDTQRQLSLTDQFRFVNYNFDSTAHKIKVHYLAVPLEKYQVSADVGLNVIQLQGAPGPFANLSYKIRNVFNGLENFEANLRAGIELVPGFVENNGIYKSQEIGLNTSLTFPRLLIPFTSFQNKSALYNPRTQVGLGYNFVQRPEYTRTNVKVAMSYSWQPTTKALWTLSFIDLNILNTTKKSADFQALLDTLFSQGNNLKYSFQPSFVSDVNLSFIHNTNSIIGPQKNAHYLRVALESGGTTLNFLPGQEKLIQNVFGDLQFYKYLRANIDYRRYWPVGRQSSFVARVNSGAIYSYADGGVTPYEKYFFAGGSNSVRAWLPRRLGPGSAAPRVISTSTSTNLTFEAPGDFLLEGNLEWRGHLAKFFGDINYALFIDAGNVWSLNGSAPEAQKFKPSTFAREIAVGTGFGIRYDLSFFILRFDFGTKVYDPYTQKFVLDKLKLNRLFNRNEPNFLNINLGVGYPF